MSKIITIKFTDDFIERLADYIHTEYIQKGRDLRRVALVFGGHRPYLFLKRELARKLKTNAYYPPQFFTIDDWIRKVVGATEKYQTLSQLDHCFLIYELTKTHAPQLLEGRTRFASFLPWAQEILSLIEQLDLESVSADSLKNLKAEAEIGFDVPVSISRLLESLFVLREAYRKHLVDNHIASRGYQYDLASRLAAKADLSAFDEILFCNFFYLHRSEMKMMEHCFKRANTTVFIQGDQRRWPALKRIATALGQDILEGDKVIEGSFNLKLHAAFDVHSQAATVARILENVSDPERTVIVLPHADSILPLLSSISSSVKEFNISMGYPLKRSALYALLEKIFMAQRSMQPQGYYTRDYLRVLHHPLVKSLTIGQPQLVRVLVQKIDEVLTGQIRLEHSGALFVDLDKFLGEEKLYEEAQVVLAAMNMSVSTDDLKAAAKTLHEALFKSWQKAVTFKDLSLVLGEFTALMQQASAMSEYPFNERIAVYMENLSQELASSQFASQSFIPTEMFRILEDTLSRQMVAFSGSPLRGLQILGLFETRALSFDNVIVLDVNEGVLPNLNIYEPLIPRDIMIKLNLDRLELEEEIQRYGFMRLISSAKNVHLIYQERADRERSRLIEELIWQEEKKSKKLNVVSVERGRFQVQVAARQRVIQKTPAMVEFLKNMTFSASSLNTYLRNPYEFYENYMLGLREQDNLLDEPEARHVGTFVHDLLEVAFKGFVNKKPVLDAEFKKYFMKVMEGRFEDAFGKRQRGDSFLMRAVLETRFDRFYEAEAKRCVKEVDAIVALEKKFNDVIDLNGKKIKMTYRMDRVDRLIDGSILVLDYKTGGMDLIPKGFDNLLEGELTREMIRDELLSFQMPLYLDYLIKQYPNTKVNAGLYHLKTHAIEKFLKDNDPLACQNALTAGLRALDFVTDELFDLNVPFVDDPIGEINT